MEIRGMELRPWVIPVATAVGALAVGGAAGYVIGFKRGAASVEFPEDADENVKQISLLDYLDEVGDDILVPESEAEEIAEAIEDGEREVDISIARNIIDEEDYETTASIVVNERNDPRDIVVLAPNDEPIEEVTVNIFAHVVPDWDYDAEQANRQSGGPYVLHVDEFMNDETGFRQEVLTYYSGDDILVDGADQPVPNYERIVGELRFGHGSNDANVVYVRNESVRMEWEILNHPGRYAVEVLGLEIEQNYESNDLKHSADRRLRMDD